jgi:hypothetical protein
MAVELSRPLTPNELPSSLLAPLMRGMWMNFPWGIRVLG